MDLLICVSSGHKLHVIKYLDLQKWIAVVDTVHSEHRSWGDILKMLDAAKLPSLSPALKTVEFMQ